MVNEFILMIIGGWYAELLDVQGAFFHGDFEEGTSCIWKFQMASSHFFQLIVYCCHGRLFVG